MIRWYRWSLARVLHHPSISHRTAPCFEAALILGPTSELAYCPEKTRYRSPLSLLFSCLRPRLVARDFLTPLLSNMSLSHHVGALQEPTPLGHLLLGPSVSAHYHQYHNGILLAQLDHRLTVLQSDKNDTGTPREDVVHVDVDHHQDLGTISHCVHHLED